ncbi:MAG: peroxide stress protein YaaA [Candidatus Cloacimonetes bacterium]|nr:peroxide stress protein YaaA [Candidatus Cloacimonadota bacterium]
MICVISPSKALDFERPSYDKNTELTFKSECLQLSKTMKKQSVEDIRGLMKVSENIATLNHQRYQDFSKDFVEPQAKTAIRVFKGEVYNGLDALSFSDEELEFSQSKVRILSGLYGLVKPLDLIQAYRLEMGIPLKHKSYTNLYEFWGNKITKALNKDLKEQEHPCLINLASKEYFKSIKVKELNAPLINVNFKDNKNGVYKIIAIYAKKARGMMARYIVQEKIQNPEHLKDFTLGGYQYNKDLSTESDWVFTR